MQIPCPISSGEACPANMATNMGCTPEGPKNVGTEYDTRYIRYILVIFNMSGSQ